MFVLQFVFCVDLWPLKWIGPTQGGSKCTGLERSWTMWHVRCFVVIMSLSSFLTELVESPFTLTANVTLVSKNKETQKTKEPLEYSILGRYRTEWDTGQNEMEVLKQSTNASALLSTFTYSSSVYLLSLPSGPSHCFLTELIEHCYSPFTHELWNKNLFILVFF